MRQFGLIGYPLGHSFSKKFFSEKFEREGLTDCHYELFPIKNIGELPALLEANPQLEGLNITIPYKQQVITYLNDTENLPQGLNACNCIKINNGQLTGYNTDTVGFEKSFTKKLKTQHSRALVLGNGGAASAVFFVLKKLGIPFEVVSRQLHAGSTYTYSQLTPDLVATHTIIINTTPLGTYPNIDQCPDIPYNAISSNHYLFDLVYNPAKTLFLQKGEEKGATIENGYDMLVEQALESWRIWNQPS